LQRGGVVLEKGHDDVPVARGVLLLDDHVVAVVDVIVDHRLPAHAEDVRLAAARRQVARQREALGAVLVRVDRLPRGDLADHRGVDDATAELAGEGERAGPGRLLLETPFLLELGEVVVDGGRRSEPDRLRALARNRAQANVTILLGNIAQLLVFTIGVLVILAIYTQGAFGWILTSFSVVGIVIGLSLQDILKNFFAGIWVLVERPFRIGDTIEVSGHTGVVEE